MCIYIYIYIFIDILEPPSFNIQAQANPSYAI